MVLIVLPGACFSLLSCYRFWNGNWLVQGTMVSILVDCWFQSFVVLAASFSPFVPFDSGAAFFDGVFPLLPLCCVGLPYLIVSGCVQPLLPSIVMWGFDFLCLCGPMMTCLCEGQTSEGDFEFLNPMPTTSQTCNTVQGLCDTY